MPITLICSQCQKPFAARDESAGRKVRCPACGAILAVPAPKGSTASAGPPSSQQDFSLPPPPPGRASGGDDFNFAGQRQAPDTIQPDLVADPPRAASSGFPGRNPQPSRGDDADTQMFAEEDAGKWRAARRGLSRMQWAAFLFFMPILAEFGTLIYKVLMTEDDGGLGEGYLDIGLTLDQEILLGVAAIFGGLGVLLNFFGKFSACSAPRASMAGRTLAGSFFFYLIALVGVGIVVAAHITAQQMPVAEENRPQQLEWYIPAFDEVPEEALAKASPLNQDWFPAVPVGAHLFVIGLFMSEILLLLGLAQMGAALHERRAGNGVGRIVSLLGLTALVGTLGVVYIQMYNEMYLQQDMNPFLVIWPPDPASRSLASGALLVLFSLLIALTYVSVYSRLKQRIKRRLPQDI